MPGHKDRAIDGADLGEPTPLVLAQGGKQASAGLQRNHKIIIINVSVNYD